MPSRRAPASSPRDFIATLTACADVLKAGRAAATAGGTAHGKKASPPLTFLRLQQLMSLRTVHIRGDGFCFARFTLFLLAEDARDTCFLSRASVKEDLLGGGKAAAAEWVPTKRMHMCARVTPCPLRARNTVPPPTHPHAHPRCGIIVASFHTRNRVPGRLEQITRRHIWDTGEVRSDALTCPRLTRSAPNPR